MTFHILHRNRVLIEQKSKLHALSLKAKTNIKKGIDAIVENIDNELDEKKDWQYIEPQLDKVYNNFLQYDENLAPSSKTVRNSISDLL